MNITDTTTLILNAITLFGEKIAIILGAVIGIGVAYLVFNSGWHLLQGTTFTSWAWLDRMTYKPYKGYNRFRSRKWNMENTMN